MILVAYYLNNVTSLPFSVCMRSLSPTKFDLISQIGSIALVGNLYCYIGWFNMLFFSIHYKFLIFNTKSQNKIWSNISNFINHDNPIFYFEKTFQIPVNAMHTSWHYVRPYGLVTNWYYYFCYVFFFLLVLGGMEPYTCTMPVWWIIHNWY